MFAFALLLPAKVPQAVQRLRPGGTSGSGASKPASAPDQRDGPETYGR